MDFQTEKTEALNTATCSMGEYTHDIENKVMEVCISGRNKSPTMYLDINAVICRYLCSDNPLFTGPREDFIRKWSNVSQWPNQRLPQ